MLSQEKNNKLDQSLTLQPYACCRSSREKKTPQVHVLNSEVSLERSSCFHGKLTHSELSRTWTGASYSDKFKKIMPQQRFFCLYFDNCQGNYFVWEFSSCLTYCMADGQGAQGLQEAQNTGSDSASGLAFLITSPAAGHGA